MTMFTLRSAVVSLAFFAVMYCTLSCLVASGWWALGRARRMNTAGSAGFLFGLRIFPLAISALVAISLTLPSFWLMERRSFDEDGTTFLLAAFALLLLTAGAVRVLRAQLQTTQAVTEWLARSGSDHNPGVAVISAPKGAPALMLVGVCRPQVMVSDTAAAVLSEQELQVAVRHELAHKRSCDNLKKLLINATPFPGMSAMEAAWRKAAELAADDAAVSSRQEALNLASALIKISRSWQQPAEPELASGLVCDSFAVSLRVRRLLQWRAADSRLQRTWPWALLSVVGVAGIAAHYGAMLILTHRLTELIVP
jgi:Zn-dependent protease with chaperone function